MEEGDGNSSDDYSRPTAYPVQGSWFDNPLNQLDTTKWK